MRKGLCTRDETNDYTREYQKTFSIIKGDEVIALMKNYLPDLHFGFLAACVLLDIFTQKKSAGNDKYFWSYSDFSKAKERRVQLLNTHEAPSTCDFSEAIFDIVKKIDVSDEAVATQQHAINLARIALRMPHGIKKSEVTVLFNLPQKNFAKQELFTVSAMAGIILPAEILLAELRNFLNETKEKKWRLDSAWGELMRWIELFPFSDKPIVVFDALDLIPAEYKNSWQLSRLLSALGNSPDESALSILILLLERMPELIKNYEWLNALINLNTEAAAKKFLELTCEKKIAENFRAYTKLVMFAGVFPLFKNEILQSYKKLPSGMSKIILESALIDLSDEQIVLELIHDYAVNNKTYHETGLSQALRKIAVDRRRLVDFPGAFEAISVSLTELRKKLFHIYKKNNTESSLAKSCLDEIDSLRDEYGRLNNEPRHPDINLELSCWF